MNNIIKDKIIKLNENIYGYKLKDLAGDLFSIMDGVNSCMKAATDTDRNAINLIYKAIVKAMENRDYLLIADILMFELLPMVDFVNK